MNNMVKVDANVQIVEKSIMLNNFFADRIVEKVKWAQWIVVIIIHFDAL